MYKVGDNVRIRHYLPGTCSADYTFGFTTEMEKLAGKEFTIRKVYEEYTKHVSSVKDDGCKYCLSGEATGFSWASSMFEESAFVTKKSYYKPNFNI